MTMDTGTTFTHVRFTRPDPDWSPADPALAARITTVLGDPNLTPEQFPDAWGDRPTGPITLAAQDLTSWAPVATVGEVRVFADPAYGRDYTTVAELRPWLVEAAGVPLDDLGVAAALALAGFATDHTRSPVTVNLPYMMFAFERARRSKSGTGGIPTYWPSRFLKPPKEVLAEAVTEVLADMPGLADTGLADPAAPDFGWRRGALTRTPADRIAVVASALTNLFPAVRDIWHAEDAAPISEVASWVTLRRPELGSVLPGEVAVSAALAGYQMTVADADEAEDVWLGIPRQYVCLHRVAMSEAADEKEK